MSAACLLYLGIAHRTPDSCTTANLECDGFGSLEDFLQAFGVITALVLLALAWLVVAGRRWAWILAVVLTACIGIASMTGLSDEGSGAGVAGPSQYSAAHVLLGILNLAALGLLLVPAVFRWTASRA
ncbi:hypothetical protein AB0A73_21660 [Glycomyces sp. NPDC047369]